MDLANFLFSSFFHTECHLPDLMWIDPRYSLACLAPLLEISPEISKRVLEHLNFKLMCTV